jgi:hypothetical protein
MKTTILISLLLSVLTIPYSNAQVWKSDELSCSDILTGCSFTGTCCSFTDFGDTGCKIDATGGTCYSPAGDNCPLGGLYATSTPGTCPVGDYLVDLEPLGPTSVSTTTTIGGEDLTSCEPLFFRACIFSKSCCLLKYDDDTGCTVSTIGGACTISGDACPFNDVTLTSYSGVCDSDGYDYAALDLDVVDATSAGGNLGTHGFLQYVAGFLVTSFLFFNHAI